MRIQSNRDAEEALWQAERPAAAPYVDYPPTPAWYPPAIGLRAAAFCLAMGIPSGGARKAVAVALLGMAESGFAVWYRRYRGVLPRGRAPEEVRKVLTAFIFGAVVVIGVVTPAIMGHERAYTAAASSTRARLA
ncbi:hypothetical protein [Sciscionella sediminilitoris]|uniref:hypothetical protein n=1 Tax=Sciscionella sediminilitoris TaxID=1445613 RepID=UPI0012E167E1|nr:hypothetical protein [Sciscionella sp. SE31]